VTSTASGFAEFFETALADGPVIALFRGLPANQAVQQCRAAWAAGIKVVEIPLMVPSDRQALERVVEAASETGGIVGAGTITSLEGLRIAADVGAAFTVSPGALPDVLELSEHLGFPHLPGAATATEVSVLARRGYRWLKAFPAAALTPHWFTAMRGPFPQVTFVATGGITPDSGLAFLEAGCGAVALGSALAERGGIERLQRLLQWRRT
jgi:2-dehydro-3-deoxyphosphogluconate aldolase / (4S)-4-hydroxy-2-oxoglutarate aldolase